MRNKYVLSKSDSICKVCGGYGVLSTLTGLTMCVLPEYNLVPIGAILLGTGIITLVKVFHYLIKH